MIDEEKPIPYHLQVKEILKKEILDDKYAEKIPSERELMERFKVSRTTIREAVNHLVNEGLLEKLHGKGTFIKKHRPIQDWLLIIEQFDGHGQTLRDETRFETAPI